MNQSENSAQATAAPHEPQGKAVEAENQAFEEWLRRYRERLLEMSSQGPR